MELITGSNPTQRPLPGVLVVDDDEVDRLAVKRSLRRCQNISDVFEARDGFEALELLHQPDHLNWPYLILLDINMPRMNGIEFLSKLRQDPQLRRTPVFILTTSDNHRDMTAAYDQVVAGYLLKQDVLNSDQDLSKLIDKYSKTVTYPTEQL